MNHAMNDIHTENHFTGVLNHLSRDDLKNAFLTPLDHIPGH